MDLNEVEDKMQKAVESLKADLTRVRTGRASPQLVDSIKVDYFGAPTPLNQLAQISIPDPKTVQITTWDQSSVAAIEKSIIAANIGLNPNSDGKIIRLNVPALTEDRRKDIARSVKKMGEDHKIVIRNHRRDANDHVKALEKKKEIGEDESKTIQESIQKLTDKYSKEVDILIDSKSKDILTI